MRLSVHHETDYRYGAPNEYSIQYLRLTPRGGPSQIVRGWSVTGPARMRQWTDAFGNIVHVLVVNGAHDRIHVQADGTVETVETHGVQGTEDGGLNPIVFLRPTALTRPDAAIERLIERPEKPDLETLHRLMQSIQDAMEFRVGHTDVLTTAADALAAGAGVCQDFAHVYISAARSLGIPARYVSGYLFTGEHAEPFDASHAWAEVLVDDLGWVGFDAANGVSPSDAYVRTAVGRDYGDAAPVRGLRRGFGDEALEVRVRIRQAGGQVQS